MNEKGHFRICYSGRTKGCLTLTGRTDGGQDVRAIVKWVKIRRFVLMIRESVMEGIELKNGTRYSWEVSGPSPVLCWDLRPDVDDSGELTFELRHRDSTERSRWDCAAVLTEDEARELGAFLGYVLSCVRSEPGRDLHLESELMFNA